MRLLDALQKVLPGRKIGDGQRFALWHWEDIAPGPELYIRKLYLYRCPLHQASVHWIYKQDFDRDPHDHPRDFVTFMLRGGYTETRYTAEPARHLKSGGYVFTDFETAYRGRGSVAYRKAEGLHRIVDVDPGTVTLVLWGRKRREWGFRVLSTGRWIFWRDYLGLPRRSPSTLMRLTWRERAVNSLKKWWAA